MAEQRQKLKEERDNQTDGNAARDNEESEYAKRHDRNEKLKSAMRISRDSSDEESDDRTPRGRSRSPVLRKQKSSSDQGRIR